MSFDERAVLIAGASAGIGLEVARAFARHGADLALAARGAERLEAVAAELRTFGGRVEVIPTDVADPAACLALVSAAVERLGRLDVLVNNAGLHHRGPFGDHDPLAYAAMVDVNLRAPIVLTAAALPHLRATGGSVVNVGSLAGCLPLPEAAVYSATKAGLRTLSLALAGGLEGVRVSVVSPGPVATAFILDDLDSVGDITLAQPMSTPGDIAALVLACAADGRPERQQPRSSGLLAGLGATLPSLRRVLGPLMERRGRRVKERLRRAARER